MEKVLANNTLGSIEIKKDVLIKNYTTFKIGGRAKYFTIVRSAHELIKAILLARDKNLPFFILGGGSNILFPDKVYPGLVIKIESNDIQLKGNKIYAEAGVRLSNLVSFAFQNRLSGLEWAIGIPGTLGGAIRGNAGAFKKSIGKIVGDVEFLKISPHLEYGKIRANECNFGYRTSIFKQEEERGLVNLIILAAEIKLKKGEKKGIETKMKKFAGYRKESQPLNFPSAGSIFKNWKGIIRDKNLLGNFKEIKEFNKKREIPAAYLIEKAGLKGEKVGGAIVSVQHSNFIINAGGAKYSDVISLIKKIKSKVRKKFKIDLEEEIKIISF